jgi:type I restriction enzyme S subunit
MKSVKVSQIAEVHYGSSLKADQRVQDGKYAVFGSNGVIGNHDQALFTFPSSVIGRKGSVGEVIFAPRGGWAIDTFFYTEIKDRNQVEPKYLFYALKKSPLTGMGITTSIPGLSRESIYRTRINLPPLPEQRRIAGILDKVDALKQKRVQAKKLAGELVPSLFQEMFGGVRGKEWPRRKLGILAVNITKGESPGWQGFQYLDAGIPFITSENVRWGYLELKDVKYIAPAFHAKLHRSVVRHGDVLINLVGASIGRTAVVQADIEANVNQAVCVITIGPELLNVYLANYLLTKEAQETLRKNIVESARANISLRDVRELAVSVPPMPLQRRFVDIVNRFRALESKLAGTGVEELAGALQQRLLG